VNEEQAKLEVRVQPNANHNSIAGFREGVLYLKIAAPPVKGKANQELIAYLVDILDTSKSSISIQKGQTGRRKSVSISGLSQDSLLGKITGLLEQR